MSILAIRDPGYIPNIDLPREAIVGAYHSIRDTIERVHAAIERLSPFQRLLVKTTMGVLLGLTLMPLNLGIVVSVNLLVLSVIGKQRFIALHDKFPSYDGEDLSKMGLEICILVPILEEVIFRGMIQPGIKFTVKHLVQPFVSAEAALKIATITAIGLTAILFGVVHFTNHTHWLVGLPQVVMATFGGIVHGIEREYGTLAMPIADHIAHNTIAFCGELYFNA